MTQHLDALAIANKNRTLRRKIKDDIADGIIRLEDLIHDPPEAMLGAKVFDFLIAKRYTGRLRALEILRRSDCSELIRVRKLTDRQKKLLIKNIQTYGIQKWHDDCPGCGESKRYTSRLCVRCSNKSRARR